MKSLLDSSPALAAPGASLRARRAIYNYGGGHPFLTGLMAVVAPNVVPTVQAILLSTVYLGLFDWLLMSTAEQHDNHPPMTHSKLKLRGHTSGESASVNGDWDGQTARQDAGLL